MILPDKINSYPIARFLTSHPSTESLVIESFRILDATYPEWDSTSLEDGIFVASDEGEFNFYYCSEGFMDGKFMDGKFMDARWLDGWDVIQPDSIRYIAIKHQDGNYELLKGI